MNSGRDPEEMSLVDQPKFSPLKEQRDGFRDGYNDCPHQRRRTRIYANAYKKGRLARIEDDYYAALRRIRGVEVPA